MADINRRTIPFREYTQIQAFHGDGQNDHWYWFDEVRYNSSWETLLKAYKPNALTDTMLAASPPGVEVEAHQYVPSNCLCARLFPAHRSAM